MKLTETIKDAFINAVMADVPYVDYSEKARAIIQEDAAKQLPHEIKKIWDNPKLRGYITTHYTRHFCFSAEAPDGRTYSPSKTVATKLEKMQELDRGQSKIREDLKRKLNQAVRGCNTRKQLADALPEFEKYLPMVDGKTANLPALANVVSDFKQAGWPKGGKSATK